MFNVVVAIFSLAIGLLIYKLYLEHKMTMKRKEIASKLSIDIIPGNLFDPEIMIKKRKDDPKRIEALHGALLP